MKPLDSGHLRVLKNLSVIKSCPLLGGSLTKIVTFGTKRFVRYSKPVRYLGCPLLGGFTVYASVVRFGENSAWTGLSQIVFLHFPFVHKQFSLLVIDLH